MKLGEYLKQNNVSQEELANRCGVTRCFVNRMIKGEKHASAEVALKIHEATGKAVPLEILVAPGTVKLLEFLREPTE